MDSNKSTFQADTSSTPEKLIALASHKESNTSGFSCCLQYIHNATSLQKRISLTSAPTHRAFVYYGGPH